MHRKWITGDYAGISRRWPAFAGQRFFYRLAENGDDLTVDVTGCEHPYQHSQRIVPLPTTDRGDTMGNRV